MRTVVPFRQAAEPVEILDTVVAFAGAFMLGGLAGLSSDDLRADGTTYTLDRVPVRLLGRAFRKGNHGLRGYGLEHSLAALINGSVPLPPAWAALFVDAVVEVYRQIHSELGVVLDPFCGCCTTMYARHRWNDEGWGPLRCVVVGNHHTPKRWPSRFACLRSAVGEDAWLWAAGLEDPVRLVDVLPHAKAPTYKAIGDELDADAGLLPKELSAFYKADLLVGGLHAATATSVSGLMRTVYRKGYPTVWSPVSVKEKLSDVESGPGLHWAIARGSENSRGPFIQVQERKGDPGFKVVRVPAHGPFLQANDVAFWALTDAFGGQVAARQVPRHVGPKLRQQAQQVIKVLVENAQDVPVMELGWSLLNGQAVLDAKSPLESALSSADRRLHSEEHAASGKRPPPPGWRPRLVPLPIPQLSADSPKTAS